MLRGTKSGERCIEHTSKKWDPTRKKEQADLASLFTEVGEMSFRECINLLGIVFDTFKESVLEHQRLRLKHDYKPFEYGKAQKLLKLIGRSRFLATNLDEEYRVHELCKETQSKGSLSCRYLRSVPDANKPTNSDIFARLSASTAEHVVPWMTPEKKAETEQDKMNLFISKCLRKIVPKRTIRVSSSKSK